MNETTQQTDMPEFLRSKQTPEVPRHFPPLPEGEVLMARLAPRNKAAGNYLATFTPPINGVGVLFRDGEWFKCSRQVAEQLWPYPQSAIGKDGVLRPAFQFYTVPDYERLRDTELAEAARAHARLLELDPEARAREVVEAQHQISVGRSHYLQRVVE